MAKANQFLNRPANLHLDVLDCRVLLSTQIGQIGVALGRGLVDDENSLNDLLLAQGRFIGKRSHRQQLPDERSLPADDDWPCRGNQSRCFCESFEVVNRKEGFSQNMTAQVFFESNSPGTDIKRKAVLNNVWSHNFLMAFPVWACVVATNLLPIPNPVGRTIRANVQFVRCVDHGGQQPQSDRTARSKDLDFVNSVPGRPTVTAGWTVTTTDFAQNYRFVLVLESYLSPGLDDPVGNTDSMLVPNLPPAGSGRIIRFGPCHPEIVVMKSQKQEE